MPLPPLQPSKAHTATANRVARRYGGVFERGEGPDIETEEMVVYVATTATMRKILREVALNSKPAYLAVTNMEASIEALRAVQGTEWGVLSPKGEILRQAGGT